MQASLVRLTGKHLLLSSVLVIANPNFAEVVPPYLRSMIYSFDLKVRVHVHYVRLRVS